MSFSILEVKRKSTSFKDKIRYCYSYIKSNDILTDNVKYALDKYISFRFTKRTNSNFTSNRLKEMTEDLLSYCCNKPYVSISIQDVMANESQILYEIKRAIFYGATKCLYNPNLGTMNINETMFKQGYEQPKRLENIDINQQVVIDYFKDLMV